MSDPRPRSELLDRVLSASAALVAASALAVSVYQARIMREQQVMSAWPYVVQGNTGVDPYARIVQNVGLGPALVRSFIVEVDGRPVHYWGELREAVEHGSRPAPIATRSTSSTLRRGLVLLPGTPSEVLHVEGADAAARMRAVLTDERVRMRVCYCSLYEDCWTSDTREYEPVRVAACPSDATREFYR